MVTISDFLEATAAFINVKKEQIYLHEDVNKACNDISQILINSLKENSVELTEEEVSVLIDKFFGEIVNSLDLIVATSYSVGFIDSLKFQELIKEME